MLRRSLVEKRDRNVVQRYSSFGGEQRAHSDGFLKLALICVIIQLPKKLADAFI